MLMDDIYTSFTILMRLQVMSPRKMQHLPRVTSLAQNPSFPYSIKFQVNWFQHIALPLHRVSPPLSPNQFAVKHFDVFVSWLSGFLLSYCFSTMIVSYAGRTPHRYASSKHAYVNSIYITGIRVISKTAHVPGNLPVPCGGSQWGISRPG